MIFYYHLHTCEIDMGSFDHEHRKNLTLLRELDNRQGDPYDHGQRDKVESC